MKVNVARLSPMGYAAVAEGALRGISARLESNDSILLNALPVHYVRSARSNLVSDAELR